MIYFLCLIKVKKKQNETKEVYLIANTPIVATEKEGCTFVGYYQLEESSKRAILYREGSIAPAGKYELIYVENSKKDITGKYSFPAMVEDGLTRRSSTRRNKARRS